MPGKGSELLLHTAVFLIYKALYSDTLELDTDSQDSREASEPHSRLKPGTRRPHPKMIPVEIQPPKQVTTVLGVQKALRRAIGTVQYEEAHEVSVENQEDILSISTPELQERLPLRLLRTRTSSLRPVPQSFEALRVN